MLPFCKTHHPGAHNLKPHVLGDDIPVPVLMVISIGVGVGIGIGIGVKREEE